MELKKNPKSDLEKMKSTFLQIGFIVALGVLVLAFEWSTRETSIDTFERTDEEAAEDEQVEVTRQEEPKPPEVKQEIPQIVEVFRIKDDDEDTDDLDMLTDEADETTFIEPVVVKKEKTEEQIFYKVEKMPEFPGGDLGLRRYIASHVEYPAIARESNIQGKVFIRFVVNSKGRVANVSLVRGIDPLLDQAALKVVRNLPKWKAGEQGGKKVNVWYSMPINFQLE